MKRSSKKGFTLAELLIVVAIIAILIAIMFPVFGAQLSKARLAADTANLRSAYSEAVANKMLETDLAPTAPAEGATTTDYTIDVEIVYGPIMKYGSTPSYADHVVTVSLGRDSMTFEIDPDVNLTLTETTTP